MPSSYSLSAQFTLQVTGENNNTWGVILNQGVFQLVDDTVNGRLALVLSGSHTLVSAPGATDESRMAFLDVTGGSGGSIITRSVPISYFVHNGASGPVTVGENMSPSPALFGPGDAGPMFNDGAGHAYPILIAGLTVQSYVNAAISSASGITLPPTVGNVGKALLVRNIGSPPALTWTPDFIAQADVQGLPATLTGLSTQIATNTAQIAVVEDEAMAFALLF
jgi:hypothetical protein